jgi:hypothetical protein
MHWYGVKPWELDRFTTAELVEMFEQLPRRSGEV